MLHHRITQHLVCRCLFIDLGGEGSVGVKGLKLPKNTIQCPQSGIKPRPLNPKSRTLTERPQCLLPTVLYIITFLKLILSTEDKENFITPTCTTSYRLNHILLYSQNPRFLLWSCEGIPLWEVWNKCPSTPFLIRTCPSFLSLASLLFLSLKKWNH